MEIFVGLCIAPGFGLVDTGAQHGVLGPQAFRQIEQLLAQWDLKPRIIPTLQMKATGVGGSSSFVKSAEIPIAIQGTCGTLTIHVVNQEIPLLLPVDFCRKLGMVLSMPKQQIHWEYIKRYSDVHEVGNSRHLAIEIFEFLKTGRKNPHENSQNIVGQGSSVDREVKRCDFEINPVSIGSKSHSETLLQHSTHLDARGTGMSHCAGPAQQQFQPGNFIRSDNRSSEIDHRSAPGKVEDFCLETYHGSGQLSSQEAHPSSAGEGCISPYLSPSQGPRGCTATTDHECNQWGDRRQAALSRGRHGGGGPRSVPASCGKDEEARKQNIQVVDLSRMSKSLGTDECRGSDVDRNPEWDRDSVVWQACGSDVLTCVRQPTILCPVGNQDSTGTWGRVSTTIATSGKVPESESEAGRVGTDTVGHGGKHGRRCMNQVFHGSLLCLLLALLLLGYIV